jgi:hypothetical protein
MDELSGDNLSYGMNCVDNPCLGTYCLGTNCPMGQIVWGHLCVAIPCLGTNCPMGWIVLRDELS